MKNNRMILSFTKEELKRSSLSLENSGIMIAMPDTREASEKLMQSFGWAGNNSNVFYPDLNVAADLIPKPEDFVNVPFRLLSATIVAAGTWRATDFTDAAVLKESIYKLADKPVYKEHETDLDNWVGLVRNPKFSPAFTMKDGISIPAGIDGIISIDGKTNPKLARAVLAGGIYSNSVTVEFEWLPSHKFETPEDFERNVGQVIDGKMVCRKVSKIIDYYESSLVWLGADPYAKQIKADGDLIHVDESSTYNDEVVQTTYKSNSKYSVKLGLTENILSLSKQSQKINPMKPEVIAAFRKKFNLAADVEITEALIESLTLGTATDATLNAEVAAKVAELTGETIEATTDAKVSLGKLTGFKGLKAEALTKLENDAAKVVTLEADKAALATEKTTLAQEVGVLKADKVTLEAKVTELTPKATIGEKFVADKRAETIRLYKLSTENKPVEAVLTMFEKASVEELDGLLASYGKGLTAKFNGKCTDCGSTNFEFKSSQGGGEGESKEVSAESAGVTYEDIRNSFKDEEGVKTIASRYSETEKGEEK